jgi:polynucleotide 5'-kinase involved in rRNA processing
MKSITFKATEAKGPVIVLIGRRDTGKSYLVRPPSTTETFP